MKIHHIPITPDEYNILSCYVWPASFNIFHYSSAAKDIYKRVLIIGTEEVTKLHKSLVSTFDRNKHTFSKPEARGLASLLVQLKACD